MFDNFLLHKNAGLYFFEMAAQPYSTVAFTHDSKYIRACIYCTDVAFFYKKKNFFLTFYKKNSRERNVCKRVGRMDG